MAAWPNRSLHSAMLTYRDGRPPCGFHGNIMRSTDLDSISCSNCQGQLLIAMALGVIDADFAYWWRKWHPDTAQDATEALSRYRTCCLNRAINAPRVIR